MQAHHMRTESDQCAACRPQPQECAEADHGTHVLAQVVYTYDYAATSLCSATALAHQVQPALAPVCTAHPTHRARFWSRARFVHKAVAEALGAVGKVLDNWCCEASREQVAAGCGVACMQLRH